MRDDGRGAKFKSTEGLRLVAESKTGKEQESGIDQNLFNRKEKEGGGGKENAA